MFDLKEFNGTLVTEPYSVNSFNELERQILKEIVFYGSGFGWNTTSNEVEEHHFLFPYADKESAESLEGYITNLKIFLEAKIRYQYRVAKTFKAMEGFSWSIDVTDNKAFFVLSLFKM